MGKAQPRLAILTISTARNHRIQWVQDTAAISCRIVGGWCTTPERLRPGECLCHWRSPDVDSEYGWPHGPTPKTRDSVTVGHRSRHQLLSPLGPRQSRHHLD